MHSLHAVGTLAARLQAAPVLFLLLDYDGTLVPFAPTPDLAEPDDELILLLQELAARPLTEVHVVSGRTRETLERWLGALPIGLHAEHGFSSRAPGASTWSTGAVPPQDWRPGVLALMRAFAARTPGALVEEKSAGVAWHYRLADPELGASQARALKLELALLLGPAPVEILDGAKVIEVLARGVHKGRLVPCVRGAGAGRGAARGRRRRPDRRGPLRGAARGRPGGPCRAGAKPGHDPAGRGPRGPRPPPRRRGRPARLTRDALSWT